MITLTTQMFLTLKCIFDMAKGIDQKFVHYGIRKDDLAKLLYIISLILLSEKES